MAKGSNAKVIVENKIKEAFGNDFIGVADKKQNDLNLLKFSKTPFIALWRYENAFSS